MIVQIANDVSVRIILNDNNNRITVENLACERGNKSKMKLSPTSGNIAENQTRHQEFRTK